METPIIIALMGAISSFAGFLFGKRKYHAEAVGAELSNMQKAIEVWKEVAEYQTGEIATLREEINELKKELSGVERRYRNQSVFGVVDELKNIVSSLNQENMNQLRVFGEKLLSIESQTNNNKTS